MHQFPSLHLYRERLRNIDPTSLEMFVTGAGELLRVSGFSEINKRKVADLSVAALDELIKISKVGPPLWTRALDDSPEVLIEDEYDRLFTRGIIGPKLDGFKSEASKETAVVFMNRFNLVGILMNEKKWGSVFSGIVHEAITHDVLFTGQLGNYDGAVQVMSAELYLPTPLLPTRKIIFLRYCKQRPDGIWAVVDVSVDSLHTILGMKCRRRPSGCLIRELPGGYSEVTWVEHVEVDDTDHVHTIYKSLLNSGLGFSAKRWVATLDRQCVRLANAMASSIRPEEGRLITSLEVRKNLLRLAARMMKSFCLGLVASPAHAWSNMSWNSAEADDVRMRSRMSNGDPGRPPGFFLTVAASLRLLVSPDRLFNLLLDQSSRHKWDILTSRGVVQELIHIATGPDPGSYVSLFRVNSNDPIQREILILQESCTDSTGSYVVFAPIDKPAMKSVLSGGNPNYVPFLPSGFAILRDSRSMAMHMKDDGQLALGLTGGCLVTLAFQMVVDSVSTTAQLPPGCFDTAKNLIDETLRRIKAAVMSL